MEHYLGVAGEMGITEEEIGAVQAIVMAVSGGRVRAQFREVRRRVKVKNLAEDSRKQLESC
jgi:hypothetical protein